MNRPAPACPPRAPKIHLQFAELGAQLDARRLGRSGRLAARYWLLAILGLVLGLLLLPVPARASGWAHDLQVPGTVPGRVQPDSLRVDGAGVSVLVLGDSAADQRLATVDHAAADVRWQAADRGSVAVRVRHASAAGWVV